MKETRSQRRSKARELAKELTVEDGNRLDFLEQNTAYSLYRTEVLCEYLSTRDDNFLANWLAAEGRVREKMEKKPPQVVVQGGDDGGTVILGQTTIMPEGPDIALCPVSIPQGEGETVDERSE